MKYNHLITWQRPSKNIIILFVFVLASTESAHANNYNVDVKSPNTASLDKVDKIQVSHFKGTSSISIPLISIKAKRLPCGLSLSSNANSVKLNQRNGWTGMGWIDEKSFDRPTSGYSNKLNYQLSDYIDLINVTNKNVHFL